MPAIQLFHHDGQYRNHHGRREIVHGEIVCRRASLSGAKPGLIVADIRLDEAPAPGLSRDITAFIEGSL